MEMDLIGAHFDEHLVDVRALDEHPGEGGEEEEVEHASHEGAHARVRRRVQPRQQEDVGQQQAQAQVAVDRRALAAKT
jgi:hypothetical protein